MVSMRVVALAAAYCCCWWVAVCSAQATPECTCVPYFRCNADGDIVSDGKGLIDIRFGDTLNSTESGSINSHSECPAFLDVCCRSPKPPTSTPAPVITQPHTEQLCGQRNPTGVNARVTGLTATQSQFGEFPWMAAILRTDLNGKDVYVCGGALIEQDVILTGAHCVQSWQHTPEQLKVRLGEWDTQKAYEFFSHEDFGVSLVLIHTDFNAGVLSNDYALLILLSAVEPAPHIATVCLPDGGPSSVTQDTGCYVTGWGKDKFGQEGNFQNVLKKVSLPMMNHRDCQDAMRTTRLGETFELHSTFNCAGGGADGMDACHGDGGSPLVCPLISDPNRYVQVGLVAWGIGCGTPGIPGVYGDVAQGMDWITSTLDSLSSDSGLI